MEREEQLKLARQLLESGVLSEESANAIKADFPELAESEDERIIDGFHTLLKGIRRDGGLTLNKVPLDKCEEWLEKQKEQKPTNSEKPKEWSEEDEDNLHNIKLIIENFNSTIPYSGGNLTPSKEYKQELISLLKSLRPQPKEEWSEEEAKDIMESAVSLVEAVEGYVRPMKGDKYVSRTEVLAKCNALKKLLGI